MPSPDIAVVVESFNEAEHSSVDRLAETLELARDATSRHGNARVVLADGGENPAVAKLLSERFPGVEHIRPGADDYDAAKRAAAHAVGARIVVYLDGDCQPTDRDWLAALTEPIVAGRAVGTAGFTMYEGGWFARVLSVMDFGFLLPRRSHDLDCYASNNAAFAADVLRRTPAPDGDMRCRCFAHAQTFARQGTPLQLAPGAFVRHEAVPLKKERLRRGWDLVTAARVDPEIREARWLRFGVLAAPLFWAQNVALDAKRSLTAGGDMGLGPISRVAAVPVMAAVRLIDLRGIVAALHGRPVPRA